MDNPEELKKMLEELKFKAETKDPKKLAAEIAHNCVRNNTIIEDVHANGGISQREMMIFMMEVTKNIEIALENKYGFFTILTESLIGNVPKYWKSAPSTAMTVSHEEYSVWQNEILEMTEEEWRKRP